MLVKSYNILTLKYIEIEIKTNSSYLTIDFYKRFIMNSIIICIANRPHANCLNLAGASQCFIELLQVQLLIIVYNVITANFSDLYVFLVKKILTKQNKRKLIKSIITFRLRL